MRAIWTGSIAFGLISIPVKLYKAVSDHRVDFDLLHEKDGGHVGYRRYCKKGDHEVGWDEIVRGYEYEDGHYVTFTDEELDILDIDTIKAIDVEEFVDADDIDPLIYDEGYYLAPANEGAVKAYRLLLGALANQGRVGIAKFALRQKERLCVLMPHGDVIVLETLKWPEEVRKPDFDVLDRTVRIAARERQMANDLVDQLSSSFDPSRYRDEYERKLRKLVKRKIEGEDVTVAPGEEKTAEVIDLMAALEESIAKARGGKGTRSRKRSSGSSKREAKPAAGDRAKLKRRFERMSRDELYELAKEADLDGRSSMDRDELAEALAGKG